MANFWDAKAPIAIAHRGGDAAGQYQENTLKAFKSAAKLGYKYLETDVVLSTDGQVVAIHGSRNRLQANIKGDLSRPALQKMSLKQIRAAFRGAGIKIATLEEILTTLTAVRFFIDPKTDEVVLPLAKLLKKLDALDRVCVASFNYERLLQFIKILKDEQVHSGFVVSRGLRPVNKSVLMLKTGRLNNVEAVLLHHSLVSREMIDLAHSQRLKVLVWTCNSPLAIKNAVRCGTDGIISDNIRLLKRILG